MTSTCLSMTFKTFHSMSPDSLPNLPLGVFPHSFIHFFLLSLYASCIVLEKQCVVLDPCSFGPLAYSAWNATFFFSSGFECIFPWIQLFEILLIYPWSLSSQVSPFMKAFWIRQSKLFPLFCVIPWHLFSFMMCAVSRCHQILNSLHGTWQIGGTWKICVHWITH